MFQAFQNKNRRALTDDEAIARGIERSAGLLGWVVAGAEGLHHAKAHEERAHNEPFHSSAQHHIEHPVANHIYGLAQSLCACSTRGHHGAGEAAQSKAFTDVESGYVRQPTDGIEWAHTPNTLSPSFQ